MVNFTRLHIIVGTLAVLAFENAHKAIEQDMTTGAITYPETVDFWTLGYVAMRIAYTQGGVCPLCSQIH